MLKLLTYHLSVHMCMGMHVCYMCMWLSIGTHVCILCVHVEDRGWWLMSSSIALHFVSWRKVSHWTQNSPVWPDYLASKFQGSSSLHCPSIGITSTHPGFLCLCGKHFIDNHLSNPAHLSLKSGDPWCVRHCHTDECTLQSTEGWTTLHYTFPSVFHFCLPSPVWYSWDKKQNRTQVCPALTLGCVFQNIAGPDLLFPRNISKVPNGLSLTPGTQLVQ